MASVWVCGVVCLCVCENFNVVRKCRNGKLLQELVYNDNMLLLPRIAQPVLNISIFFFRC